MATIVTRAAKGSPLSHAEVDANFTGLNSELGSHIGAGGTTAHAAASTSVAGFMSASDKTKLDGVASGATANTGDVTLTGTQTLTNKTLGSGSVLGADVTGGDFALTRTMLKDTGYTFLDKGSSGTTTQNLDFTAGSHQRIKATGAFTITTSNWPPTGNLGELLLELVADGTLRTITWPTINWVKSDGTTTTTAGSNGVTFQSTNNAIDFVYLWTRDGGTTIYGKVVR